MQPITYSLVVNLAALIAVTFLAAWFAQPWLVLAVIIVVVLQTHALQRFSDNDHDDDDDDEGKPMGFLADVKEK